MVSRILCSGDWTSTRVGCLRVRSISLFRHRAQYSAIRRTRMQRCNVLPAAPVVAILLLFSANYLGFGNTRLADSVSQATRANPLEPTERNIALGMNHFLAHCASCHGAPAGGKPIGSPDLASAKPQSYSDPSLFDIISKGLPGTAMPGFGSTHSEVEIWQIVLFLRKLPTLTPEEAKKLESAAPPEARHQHIHVTDQDRGAHEHHAEQPGQEHHHDVPNPQKPGQEHHHDAPKPADEPGHQHEMSQHAGHDMGGHAGHEMMATIAGGPFKTMTAIGSGTSLLPASSPMNAWHWMKGDWMLMLHGNLFADFDHQGGPRGVNKADSVNWAMLMAEHPVSGGGSLMLRGMFSGEPFTSPNGGFPELFPT